VGHRAEHADALLSIGALSRASGIPVPTLRTWEARYGYPVAARKPSGHRVYPVASVVRLRQIAAALAHGHRAREVLTASEGALRALLAAAGAPPAPPPVPGSVDVDALLAAVRAYDGATLQRLLTTEWSRLGALPFVERCVAPLLRAVGDAWADGTLDVRHEHFVAERVGDLLRTLRLPFEDRAAGPRVVLATLPGELHGLGLQMAALVLAVAGCRPCVAGTDLPVGETVRLAREAGARAVGIGVSEAAAPRGVRRRLGTLRRALPPRLTLLAGGRGAPGDVPGVTTLADLDRLDAWARDVARAG